MKEDDGSLAFLGIEPAPKDKYFGDKRVSQADMVGKEFWVIDYIKDDMKMFTNSESIIKTLTKQYEIKHNAHTAA